MTVQQIIQEIEALPSEDRLKVMAYVDELKSTNAEFVQDTDSRDEKVSRAIDETFREYDGLLRRLAQ